jgi:DNA-binding transcriptional ArsR family regulator
MKPINSQVLSFFGALADETRLQILVSISQAPLTVNEISGEMPHLSLSAVSHQLKTLHTLGIIDCTRSGRHRLYRLSQRYCWCILRDALRQAPIRSRCTKCKDIEQTGGLRAKVTRITKRGQQ